MLNADDPGEEWKGTATWNWTLDERCLEGKMSVHSAHADFNTAGFWSWNPKSKKYVWWMFNNWGHPQEGTAKYDPDGKTWIMSYRSVGLDGNRSYGRYRMTVVDNDTLDWRMDEWADALHLVKKAEMVGTYKRSR